MDRASQNVQNRLPSLVPPEDPPKFETREGDSSEQNNSEQLESRFKKREMVSLEKQVHLDPIQKKSVPSFKSADIPEFNIKDHNLFLANES